MGSTHSTAADSCDCCDFGGGGYHRERHIVWHARRGVDVPTSHRGSDLKDQLEWQDETINGRLYRNPILHAHKVLGRCFVVSVPRHTAVRPA